MIVSPLQWLLFFTGPRWLLFNSFLQTPQKWSLLFSPVILSFARLGQDETLLYWYWIETGMIHSENLHNINVLQRLELLLDETFIKKCNGCRWIFILLKPVHDHNKMFQLKFHKTYFQNWNINICVQTRDYDYGNENYVEAATPNAASDQPRSFFPFLAWFFFTWESYK